MPSTLPIPLEVDYTITPDDAVTRMIESPTAKELVRGFCRQMRLAAVALIGVAFFLFILGVAFVADDVGAEIGRNSAVIFGVMLGMALYSLLFAALWLIRSFRHAALMKQQAKSVSRYSHTGPQHLRIDDAGLEIVTADASIRYNWSAFTRLEDTESYVALIDRFGSTAALIPRTALGDHLNDFLEFAREQMAKAPPRA